LVHSVLRQANHATALTAPAVADTVVSPGSAAKWPQIDGIDTAAAQGIFGDDIDLFRRLLGRFLAEFADMALSDSKGDLANVLLGGRMHKLKGCAGTLGANTIHELAGLVEDAYATGDMQELERLLARLALQLSQVRDGSASTLNDGRTESVPSPSDLVLGPETLARLAGMLRLQSQSALDLFRSLSLQLRARLGAAPFELLEKQLDNLQFGAVALVIEGC